MLLANSVIVAAVAVIISGASPLSILTRGLPCLGLALCLLWFFLGKRGFKNYVYWIWSARELEENYLSESNVVTISRGGQFVDDGSAVFKFGQKTRTLTMDPMGKFLRVRQVWYLTVLIFIALYGIFLACAFGAF